MLNSYLKWWASVTVPILFIDILLYEVACRFRNLSIAGFIALTIFNILATVRLLHTTVCRRSNTQSNDDIANQMHTVLPRAPFIASPCLDYYIPDAGNINTTTQDRLPFQDVNLDAGRFDNKRLYKIFDHALVGEKFTELSQKFVVSVATQSSIERMYTIVDMVNYWNGSISLAAFVSGDDEFQILQIYVSYLRKCFRCIRDKISFHLVFPKIRQPSKAVKLLKGDDFINLDCAKPQDVLTSLLKLRSEETNKWRLKNVYPQNNLRNIARKGCQTKYVFAIDVDIVPSINFTEHIDKFLRNAKCSGLCAYVLPTFELDYRAKFPSDKSDVIRLRKKGLAVPFHHKIFIYNQFATNFSRWQASVNDEPVETHINHNVTNYELYYEPFYIAEDTAPPYDERFQGYGFTRNSQAEKSQEELIKISEANKMCMEQTRADEDTLDKLIAGDFTKRDKSTQCFSLCFLTFSGFFDDNANLLVEQSVDLTEGTYGRENVYKWIHKCKDFKGEDGCESAYLFYECFFKQKTAAKHTVDKEL